MYLIKIIFPVLSIVVIALMHVLTSLISWIICILVACSSIAITVILWWTYYNIKHNIDVDVKYSLLQEFTRNETAIYVLAIIATIVMVFLIVIIYFLRTKLSALAALFEEASKCMLSLPGLAGPPILAFLALGLFLAFWVCVVICLATANFPGAQPLIPMAQLQPMESGAATVPPASAKNNTDVDYKSMFSVLLLFVSKLKLFFI